ncbi:MAG: ATP-binding protein [Thermodesulfobacteriota bacterium]
MTVARAVIAALLTVTTLALAGFGTASYWLERARGLRELKNDLHVVTAQLAQSLALPLWNYEREQVVKVAESALQNRAVFAVLVRSDVGPGLLLGLSRDAQWSPVRVAEDPAPGGDLLQESAEVSYAGRPVGRVEVLVTRRFVDQALGRSLAALALGALGLSAVLVSVLFWALDRAVLRPLRAVEGYAQRMRDSDGEAPPVPAGEFPEELHNLRGSVQGMVAAQRARMQALAESERRYRVLFGNANDALFLHGLGQEGDPGRFLDVNEAACRRLGYSRDELLAMTPSDLDSPSAAQRIPAVMEQLLAQRRAVFETEHVARDGRAAPVEVAAHLFELEGRPVVLSIARDITARKREEEALRREEARLRDLVEILQYPAPDTAALLDLALERCLELTGSRFGYIYHYDEDTQAFRLNSWSREVMQACTITKPQTRYELSKTGVWGEAVRQRRPIILNDFAADHPLKKGYPEGHAPLSRYLTVPVVSNERIVAVVGVANKEAEYTETDVLQLTLLMDATWKVVERRRAEVALREAHAGLERMVAERTAELTAKARELEQANRRLLELDELKSAFLSSVSHELRTPLTSVLGFAKLVQRDFAGHYLRLGAGEPGLERRGERICQNLAIIESEGGRLSRLINDFLDLTKIESGRVEWRDQDVSPTAAILRAVEAVRGQCLDRPELLLDARIPPDLPVVRMDPDRLEQVLVNILGNAAKFTQAGRVGVRAEAREGILRVSVEDTGVGIPAEELGRIFDKFHQVAQGDTLRDKPRGSGLGLAICRQIVEHYRGRIWAESELGRGSVFHVELPLAAGVVRPAAPQLDPALLEPPPGAILARPLVVVADDDPALCSFLAQIFQDAGFGVLAALDGERALELAREHRPDLVTMDILMPGLDGREAIARLRADPELEGIPVLVISVLRQESFGGEDAALCKPVTPERLLDVVHGLLGHPCIAEPILALEREGALRLGPYFALCEGRIEQCDEAGLWRRLEEGFRGTVLLSAWAAAHLDLARLTAAPGVHVFILPDRGAPPAA